MTRHPEGGVSHSEAFSGHLEPGERPALLLVDMVEAYLTPGSPLFMDSAAAALEASVLLLEAARAAGIPVVFSNVQYRADGSDGGHFYRKVPALSVFTQGSALGHFPPALQPRPEDRIFTKQYPSAFFKTGLDEHLRTHGVDTVIIIGYSTSGCVRASALDALQYGFIPIVAQDACADRDGPTHSANLNDLGKKYAEIQSARDIAQWLAGTA